MTEILVQRRRLQDKLSSALDREEFSLVFQPKVSIDSSRITGVEVLLRWQNAGKPMVPAEFIPGLESSGDIRSVGRWVLWQTCRQARHWIDAGSPCPISVNVSAIQFHLPGFVDHVLSAMLAHQLPPGMLELEIKEGMLSENLDETELKIKTLKEHGVSICVDDFGSGYAKLSYLKRLPIDRVKMDRKLIQAFPRNDEGTIVSAVVGLAQALGLSVVGKGVECEEQLKFLQELDCDEYQGFLFSRPLTEEKCRELVGQSMMGELLTV